jgi:hypothetical protein
MTNPNDKRTPEPTKPSSPSGATDREPERVKKFDEEGGDQPQAPSERAVEAELEKAKQSQTQSPLTNAIGHSMGSEGWPHNEPAQQESPATFPQDGGDKAKPSRHQDDTFPNAPPSPH